MLYPPLDAGPLLAFSMCVFSVPLLLQLADALRKRPRENEGRLRTVYAGSGVALMLLAAVLLLNGRLDASPPNAVRVTAIQKTVTRPRTGTAYHLTVSSWRPGRSGRNSR
jgi:hypothetical protein